MQSLPIACSSLQPLCASVNLFIPVISYEWYLTIYSFSVQPFSFSSVFMVHFYVPSYGWIIFYCMDLTICQLMAI